MKNGKHKTNSFNSSNSWSKKQSVLPSLQGGAGGRLSPNQARSATNQASLRAANQVRSAANPQKRCSKCFKCFRCFISLLDQKNARFWSKSEQNKCFKCFRCFRCFISLLDQKIARFWFKSEQNRCFSVSAVPSVPHQRGPLTKREARLTKRACERLTKREARLTCFR